MSHVRIIAGAALASAALLCAEPGALAQQPDQGATGAVDPTLARDAMAVLDRFCARCHGGPSVSPRADRGGFTYVLDIDKLVANGLVVRYTPDESELYQRVRDGEMPPDEAHALTPAQIDTVRRWIDAGAPTLRPEPEQIEGMLITEEERSHWSLQPIERPPLPEVQHADRVRTPIDHFVLARLEEQGFSFSADADRATLLRRLSFDLVGLACLVADSRRSPTSARTGHQLFAM